MWYNFSNSDMSWDEFIDGAGSMNYLFFFISACFAIGSHYSRALRWKLLINSIGHKPKTKNVFASVLFMYASNIAIPRSGEVARCGTLYKYEKIPVASLLGTVVVERAFDLLSLLFFTGIVLLIQFDVFQTLYYDSALPELIDKLANNTVLILSLVIAGLVALFILYKLREKIFAFGPFKKVKKLLDDLAKSFVQVFKMDKKGLFLLHTLFIWIGYVGMFYICFFAYEPTSHLSFAAGITAFIAGSFGMVAPTNGGIGAWQIMVILALTTLGLAENAATIWANVAFIIMTVTVGVAGLVSFALLPFMNRTADY